MLINDSLFLKQKWISMEQLPEGLPAVCLVTHIAFAG
ncbi:Uncharacterised protein [Corynebacterium pilosum]|uniref:Uncharacterized protein n=1 Tax=Corynebacterium pilosum TaxID=35756 RepID=A0A376CNC1_9CORY|nr:Uncharacterised protein [Corynebacterium pilosum]